MSKLKLTVFPVLLILMALATAAVYTWTLAPGDTATVNCTGDELYITDQLTTTLDLSCADYTPVPNPTPGPPFAGAPLCATHDVRAFHGLWDAARGCHYTHEHKDNPRVVDDVLGTDFYTWAGGEISYPWQTHAGGGAHHSQPEPGALENILKHTGYNWIVRKSMPCIAAAGASGCITDLRLQAHIIFSPVDAVVRFHSYWVEAKVCLVSDPADCGTIRTGGWLDYGRLAVSTRNPNGSFTTQFVPLASDPPPPHDFSNRRLHPANSEAGTNPLATSSESFWYGTRKKTEGMSPPALPATVHIAQGDIWQNINVITPTLTNLYCRDCEFNGSTIQMHQLGFRVDQMLDNIYDADGNNRVDYNGYTDRFGVRSTTCTAVSLDCVPFILEDVPMASYSYRDEAFGISPTANDYDVSPAGEHWITYPFP